MSIKAMNYSSPITSEFVRIACELVDIKQGKAVCDYGDWNVTKVLMSVTLERAELRLKLTDYVQVQIYDCGITQPHLISDYYITSNLMMLFNNEIMDEVHEKGISHRSITLINELYPSLIEQIIRCAEDFELEEMDRFVEDLKAGKE